MPLLGRSGLDTFYAVPPSGVAIGLAQSPEPDISMVTPMHTYAIGNEVPLDPSLSYGEIYRWVERSAFTLSDVNVVLNPLLKYADPTSVLLNTPPPDWVFHESSQTSNDRWKFYPHVHSQSSTLKKFPMSEIHPAGVGDTFTIMFPCGFSFLYSREPVPSDPQQLYCMLGARTSSVQLNTPYVVEVYYFVHAAPPFGMTPVYPYSDSWKDRVFVRCTVYGLNSSNQTTETALQADLRHLRTNNSRGRIRHLAMTNKSGRPVDFATPVRRWVVSTRVNFTNPATVRSEIVLRVVGLPGFALLGVLMYPLSEIRASVRSNRVHPTMYTFDASLDLSSQFGGRLADNERYSYLPHGIDGPVRLYATVDTGGYASNESVPQPAQRVVELYRNTGGNGLAIRVREVMSKPPRLRFLSGDPPDRCSYLTDDADARPDVGLLSYPYSGGYASVPLFITNNSVKLTYRAPSSRQYANWLEFFTDDIPVRPGIMYRLVLDTEFGRYSPPQSYPYPNSSAPYMRLSFMCYQVAVYGYDKDNNLVETAFLAPFAPGGDRFDSYRSGVPTSLGPIVTTSLIGRFTYQYRGRSLSQYYNTIYKSSTTFGPVEDVGYPNPFYPFGLIRFSNNNVVKARIVVAIVQPYVRQSESVVFSSGLPSGNDSTPYLLVPPPDTELIVKKVGLHELWPVPYTTGQANFLDETTADFRNSAWYVSRGVVHSTSQYDYPGYYGGVAVISDPNEAKNGIVSIELSWNQSSEMFVWPCFRMRFGVRRSPGKAAPSLTVRLKWLRNDASIIGTVTRHLYLAQELLSSGQVTPLGNDYYEVDLPLGNPIRLTSPYPEMFYISLEMGAVDGSALHIGYFNVGFYDDQYGRSSRRVRVSAGTGPKVTINTPFIPPRVVGVEQISRYHWGVRIRPGLAYLRYVIPPTEADHSWLIRAGFNRGNDVVLVYTLPEYTATFVDGVPVSRRTERVIVRSGVFFVERPVHSGMEITVSTPGGLTVSGVGDGANRKFDVDMFSRQVTIRDSAMSSYNGDAEVTYHYYSPDYVYTGCWYEGSSGPVPAALNLSAFSKSGLSVAPFARQLVTEQHPTLSYRQSYRQALSYGISIYLLPSMVIPYSRFAEGDRIGIKLPAHSRAVRSYVRHMFGALGVSFRPNIHDNWHEESGREGEPPVYYAYSVAALRIAYIAQVPTLGWACVDLTDIRMRGGGVPVGSNVDVAAAYWDMSEWDGGYSTGAGRAIVRLPRALLQPGPNRDALTHEHIVNLVNQYLPAGIDYEVEYVD